MSIALIIKSGQGALYPNHDKKSDKDPSLVGFLECPLDEQKKNMLRLDVAVWLKDNGKKFYSMSVGGIPATLFKEEKKKSPESADYAGSFGLSREMRIAGWLKKAKGTEKDYISIAVSEKTNQQSDQPPAEEAVPTPPKAAAKQQASNERQALPEGVPGFDFI
ncbi:hypothetical protein [Ralstonia pseudosolanacearum]|uniref:hypothetical protein n=1 Tax=Ralstonia pseudosolanacearum TaxID=1310165 RepID=UPI003CF56CAE